MKVPVYNFKNEKTSELDLSDAIFGYPWNEDLVHQVLVSLEANKRKPWAHAKGRGEVRGGGKKPWRQKGTGRARHGSTRSPIWRKGGASHGPVKERDYSQKINKKMGKRALYSVLSKKLADNDIKFIDSMEVKSLKTKDLALNLKTLFKGVRPKLLLLSDIKNKTINRSARNLAGVSTVAANNVGIYDLLSHKQILIEKSAVNAIK